MKNIIIPTFLACTLLGTLSAKKAPRFISRAIDTGVTTTALAESVVTELSLLHPSAAGDAELIAGLITQTEMRVVLSSVLAQMSVGGVHNPYVGIKAQFFAIYKDFFLGLIPNRNDITSFNNDLIMIDRSVSPELAADLITFNNTILEWLSTPATEPALANELYRDISTHNTLLGAQTSAAVVQTQIHRSKSHAYWMSLLHQMQRPENNSLRTILCDVYAPFFTGQQLSTEAFGDFNRLLSAPSYAVEPDLQNKLAALNTHMIEWTKSKDKKSKTGLTVGLTVMGIAFVAAASVGYCKREAIQKRWNNRTCLRVGLHKE